MKILNTISKGKSYSLTLDSINIGDAFVNFFILNDKEKKLLCV